MSQWIKKNDKVVVVAGNEKGKTGVVLAAGNDRVLVQGVNLRKKHLKRRERNSPSEIIDIECPIHISNVAFCTQDGTKVKMKCRITAEGTKQLFYSLDGKEVVHRTIKKPTKQ